MRKQQGQIIRIGNRWHVRHWERRNIVGIIERKRVTHFLGEVTTRGKRPPADIVTEAERHMATVNRGTIPAERIVTIGDFVEKIYLPWVREHRRPSTAKGYNDIWQDHLKPRCEKVWLKDTRTFHVQNWLSQVGSAELSRNTLKHVKSVISGMFTLAKQQDYFQGENPARDTAINPRATEPRDLRLQPGGGSNHTLVASRASGNRIRSSGVHGVEAWRDTGLVVGELPRRRAVCLPLNLEWPC